MSALPLELVDLDSDQPGSIALSGLSRRPFPAFYDRFVKRAMDVTLATVLLIVLLPLMVATAVAVRIAMGPGVIYRQARVGRGGRPFVIFKLRTMTHDRRQTDIRVVDDRRVSHKRTDDPRHTSLGRFLRRTSLDELPQLVNVLRGDMSLVGPRPELVGVVRRYEDWQHTRHVVRPGITGLWQVSHRDKGLMCENSRVDLDYIRNLSLLTDLKILVRTPLAAIKRTGT